VNCRAKQSAGSSSDVGIERGGPIDQSHVPPPLVAVDRHYYHGIARRKVDRRRRNDVTSTDFGEWPEFSLGLQLQANFGRII
jgi:hypothetical protein